MKWSIFLLSLPAACAQTSPPNVIAVPPDSCSVSVLLYLTSSTIYYPAGYTDTTIVPGPSSSATATYGCVPGTSTLVFSDTTTVLPNAASSSAPADAPTPSPSTPATCDNAGMQWAYYSSPFTVSCGYRNIDFIPEYFKTQQPVVSGITTLSPYGSGYCDIPGGTADFYGYTESCEFVVIEWRGYVLADTTGTYTFGLPTIGDDRTVGWFGANAYSAWTGANENVVTACDSNAATTSYSLEANAGDYIPFRIMWQNVQGGYNFGATITDPNGAFLMDVTSPGISSNIVRFSCDEVTAPPFVS